ncbi:uncharacterized protein [Arachis hypogaea]|uniref:uncharacterized protein n=1 Tax=Arachis hypogaea TaxID=3818 RepID=UPI000DEC7C9A|nr:uncharacterized protein LOC112701058 [Arachis hypogaea]
MDDLRRDPNVENIDSEESEEDIVVLEETDISHGVKACTKSLTGRIFLAQKFSAGTMENALSAIWDKLIGFKVVNQGTNQFQFFFDEEKDMRRIEKGSPWLFKDYILHVRQWSDTQNSDDNSDSTFPIWVQFWGVPECYKTLEAGRKLGKKLGELMEIGMYKVRGKESRILKAKIMLDGDKAVKDSLKVKGPNQRLVEVGLRYECIGIFCMYCAHLGHSARVCNVLLEDAACNKLNQDLVGEWLKAD